jgi:hypothetical protein
VRHGSGALQRSHIRCRSIRRLRVFFARPFYFVNIDVLEESFALVEREIFETSKTLRRSVCGIINWVNKRARAITWVTEGLS